MSAGTSRGLACALTLWLAGCASHEPAPDWQANAHDALQRSLQAWLVGDVRIEAQEFAKARSEVTRTGRVDLVARTELSRCAGRVASLVFEDCVRFEALRGDAAPAELAYAQYLQGAVRAENVALLPEQHRALAALIVAGRADAADVKAIADPLARQIGAGVVLRAGQGGPALANVAIETASAQGWRRPLLAWLHVQLMRVQKAGDSMEEARVARRIELVQGTPPTPSPAPAARP